MCSRGSSKKVVIVLGAKLVCMCVFYRLAATSSSVSLGKYTHTTTTKKAVQPRLSVPFRFGTASARNALLFLPSISFQLIRTSSLSSSSLFSAFSFSYNSLVCAKKPSTKLVLIQPF